MDTNTPTDIISTNPRKTSHLNVILIIIVIISLAFGISYLIYKNLDKLLSRPNQNKSVFETLNMKKELTPEEKEALEYEKRKTLDLDPSREWVPTKTLFTALVKGKLINEVENTLLLLFGSPDSMPFKGQEKTVKVNCGPESEVTYYANGQWQKSENIINDLFVNDVFISICTNEECSEVGKICKGISH